MEWKKIIQFNWDYLNNKPRYVKLSEPIWRHIQEYEALLNIMQYINLNNFKNQEVSGEKT